MKLTFSNSKGEQRVLGSFETCEEVKEKIHEFLDDCVYSRHYRRGDWYEFTIIYNENNAELEV